jgi:uncharacterized membrane protein YcgQ (UPF0703/DUF1980 family)
VCCKLSFRLRRVTSEKQNGIFSLLYSFSSRFARKTTVLNQQHSAASVLVSRAGSILLLGKNRKKADQRSSFCVFLNQTKEKRGTQLALEKPHTKQKQDFKQKNQKKGNKTRKEEGTDHSRPNSQYDI